MSKYFSKILFLFMFWGIVTSAQIVVSVPDTSIESAKSITIPIYISDVTNYRIYSYQFRLKYDKDILKPKSIIDNGTISDKRSWNINAYLDKEGLIVRANGWYWLSGGGVLLYIKFDILENSGNTELTLDPFIFNNGSPVPKINNGSFRVFVNRLITFDSKGSGDGKISIDDIEYELPLEIKLQKNRIYSLKAIPDNKSSFKDWAGDLNSNDNPIYYEVTGKAEINLNFIIRSFSVSAVLEPRDYGFVEGVGVYNYGDEAMLKAIPYSGKKFVSWNMEGKIISTDPEYKFKVEDDLEVTAKFEYALFQVTANANPVEGGLVVGSGYYFPNDTVTISSNSNSDWDFINWTENGEIVSVDSDYTFIVTDNRALVANYSLVTDITEENENILDKFFISPPYPNPFNPITTFQFGIYKNAIVNLYVMDVRGTIVRKLINSKTINKGIFEIHFEANNLSSGVYFFYFEAVDIQDKISYLKTGKIILLK